MDVQIYTSQWCGFCHRAKRLLDSKEIAYQEIDVDSDPALREEMTRLSGGRTVPQIFLDGKPIGGCDELFALDAAGKL